MRLLIFALLAAALGASALACGGPTATPVATATSRPTTSPMPTAAPTPAVLAEGHRVFIAKGCGACHGENGEGTAIAPALAGHTGAQISRQVRAPLGIMPVFPPDKVSAEDLEAITEYIEGLEGAHVHVRGPGSPDELAMHHWMALFSIEADDPEEAIHHLGHITDLTEGAHLARMNEALSLLEKGDTHEAAHIVEEMLAGLQPTGLDAAGMHLTLALSSARAEETDVSIHHMEHYLELASGPEREAAAQILTLLREGNVFDAIHELEGLLGQEQAEEGHMDEHMDDHMDEHTTAQ